MNQLETYPQLITRAETVGYQINKVVFRGYQASEKLQVREEDDRDAEREIFSFGLVDE